MREKHQFPFWLRTIRALVRFAVAVAVVTYTLLDELLFPLFRPLIGWLGRLRLFQRIGEAIGRLPPYGVLVLLGVPFVLIEPAKVLAVYWAATGHVVEGTLGLIAAQILSLLVCERIFHAGYEPLMRIGWLSRLLRWLFGLRDRALGWIRSMPAWRALVAWARSAGAWVRRLLAPH